MRVSCLLFNQARVLHRAVKSVKPSAEFPCIHDFEAIAAKLKIKNLTKQCYDTVEYEEPSKLMNIPFPNEPVYDKVKKYQLFRSTAPLLLDYGGMLPQFDIAFETWGKINKDKSNVILIHPGLSASFHAHSSETNPSPGWWESFIGPGSKILDTEKYFLICTNMLGSCYGSTGPNSPHPADKRPYATRFPMLSIHDIVRAQHRLIKEHFKIDKLYAVVGSSMGGMQSLAYGQLFPNEVEKIVSISACARSHPSSIAQRHTQRQALMSDPNWNNGYYYPTPEDPDRPPPYAGMRLARQIATISYRSGPEWELRFGTERVDDNRPPVLHTDFLVEQYLDYQGSKFAAEFDPNSMLYLSKAMDLFDMSLSNLTKCDSRRRATAADIANGVVNYKGPCQEYIFSSKKSRTTSLAEAKKDLQAGLLALRDKAVLIIGVKSDVLFPYRQQREIVELLGNGPNIHHVELTEEQSLFGHDTFLLDTTYLGPSVGGFLSS